MRKVTILSWLILLSSSLLGQQSFLDPTDAGKSPEPIVNFTQEWKDGLPPYFAVSVAVSGRAAYESTSTEGEQPGVPYSVRFTASNEFRTKVFDLAHQLKNFDMSVDYKKGNIAFTGKKTLRWKNGQQEHETSYNWSDMVPVQQLTTLFQNISDTVELGRRLEEKYRYDKLGVDAELKSLEQAAKDNRLAELQIIQPMLTKIAKDSSLMNISRRRAEFLLTKVPKDAQVTVQK